MVERCIWANQEGEIHLKFYRMACIQANWKSTVQFWSVALEIEMDYLLFLQSKKKVIAMDFWVRPSILDETIFKKSSNLETLTINNQKFLLMKEFIFCKLKSEVAI